MRGRVFFIAVWLAGLCTGTTGARAPDPADLAFFEKRVRPLLVQRCWGCHSAQAKKARGGLRLDSRAAVLAGGDSGPAVVPGQPERSLLVQAVRHARPAGAMPPSGKLPARDIAALEEWVRRGAVFPDATPAAKAGRTFWSFQPLRAHTPPAVKGAGWVRRRIDAFLLAEMEKRGLAHAPEADRRTLIRRLSFDLVGLPPSPEEVETFVADPRPDAYERLVERLLVSPHHGERWGRFWLDLVRYCDVAEPWAEVKGSPHLYRDWVVGAVNDDLPYDTFVQRQLAGDLLPGSAPADKAALGFLGLSPSYWKELKLDHRVIQGVVAEEWEERIHTLTSTVLGLTVGCARCHDHKFYPIPTRDYYSLAGVFASIRPAERLLLADAEEGVLRQARQRLRALEAERAAVRKKKPADAFRLKKLNAEVAALRSQHPRLDAPAVPGVVEGSLHVVPDGPDKTKLMWKDQPQDVAVQLRGNPATPGEVVPRRFLTVLSPGEPRPFRSGSGRLELARALTAEGGPLAARVIVNRVWKHHLGEGLVRTPSDFGNQGDRPSHPELLDDLAAGFVSSGWSLRWLHREIVLCAAYRQSSRTTNRAAVTADPDNRWLARMSRRRLEVEAWRDAMLSATGTLDRRLGGPAIDLGRADNARRTLYGTVQRRELNDLLRLHDFPDPTTHSPGRTPTTTPLQQLFVLNGPLVRHEAAGLARRLAPLKSDAERIGRAYALLFGRAPTAAERRLGLEFLGASGAEAWASYAQVLLGSNEFLYVD